MNFNKTYLILIEFQNDNLIMLEGRTPVNFQLDFSPANLLLKTNVWFLSSLLYGIIQ